MQPPRTTAQDRILREMDRRGGYIRQRDVLAARADPHLLRDLLDSGEIERVRRGLYRRATQWSEHQGIADATTAAPHAVVCLLSALDYYALTTVTPAEVYLAVERKDRPPKIDYPPVRVVRYGSRMFRYGITERPLATGRTARMYSPEKSIGDAFHFDHIVGRDVALEALKSYLRWHDRDLESLLAAGQVCRVRPQMVAYLEALL